jgi:hypothetical protein
MGTEYEIAPDVELHESSCNVCFAIDNHDGYMTSRYISAKELEQTIINQVRVLSYISDDPEAVLRRFNVDYHRDTNPEVLMRQQIPRPLLIGLAIEHGIHVHPASLKAFVEDILKTQEQDVT